MTRQDERVRGGQAIQHPPRSSMKTKKKNILTLNGSGNYKMHRGQSVMSPKAPRNTSSYIMRAKSYGGIASSGSSGCYRDDTVEEASEQWGIDCYGSMNGILKLRGCEDGDSTDGLTDVDLYPSPRTIWCSISHLQKQSESLRETISGMEEELRRLKHRMAILEVVNTSRLSIWSAESSFV